MRETFKDKVLIVSFYTGGGSIISKHLYKLTVLRLDPSSISVLKPTMQYIIYGAKHLPQVPRVEKQIQCHTSI